MNRIFEWLYQCLTNRKEKDRKNSIIRVARELKIEHPEWSNRECVEQADMMVTMLKPVEWNV